jgi:hypothetical protein
MRNRCCYWLNCPRVHPENMRPWAGWRGERDSNVKYEHDPLGFDADARRRMLSAPQPDPLALLVCIQKKFYARPGERFLNRQHAAPVTNDVELGRSGDRRDRIDRQARCIWVSNFSDWNVSSVALNRRFLTTGTT